MVRINLDYYRILSVPIKANSSQLERAYEDRLRQQPRRDYSKLAIAMRKKLLTRAFQVLSNPDKRAEYNKKFLEPTNPQTAKNQNQVTKNQVAAPQVPSQETDPRPQESKLEQSSISVEPYLELEPPLVVGALIILHELAEYELVVNIGNNYLKQEADPSSPDIKPQSRNEQTLLEDKDKVSLANDFLNKSSSHSWSQFKQQETHKDVILCMALSCLEISREKWRRQEWEEAAAYGEQGLAILQQEGLSCLLHLQTEIKSELNLLKPYRILYLLEHNPIGSKLRNRGLGLLQEVLAQRNGIEKNSIGPSGLKSDQFLYFVQQIRNYLTLQEQKELFLVESNRGSHPGSCIAAYALIAEGFSHKKPSSIMQANEILVNLGQHQNTHWERAVCALLLGQAEESQEVIEQIRQDSTYALIKKRSHDSPDLLPGLCFYGEQWLNKEVLSQFQDLKSSKITLSEYFNDNNVQAYLDTIAPIAYRRQVQNSAELENKVRLTAQVNSQLAGANKSHHSEQPNTKGILGFLPWLRNDAQPSQKVDRANLKQQEKATENRGNQVLPTNLKYSPQKTLAEQTREYANTQQNNTEQEALGVYPANSVSTGNYQNRNLPNSQNLVYGDSRQRPFPQSNQSVSAGGTAVKTRAPSGNGNNGNGNNKPYAYKPRNSRRKGKSGSSKFLKSSLCLMALVAGLGTLSFLFTRGQISKNSSNKLAEQSTNKTGKKSSTQPQLTSDQPKKDTSVATGSTEKKAAISSQSPNQAPKPKPSVLDQNTAKQVIQKWLDSKKAALGKNYDSNALNKILTAQMLTQWQQHSLHYKQNKIHRQLNHSLKISSVKLDPTKKNLATVEAEVTEVAKHYQGEKLNQSQSYDDKLLVRYSLIKQNGSWLIKSSEVVKNL